MVFFSHLVAKHRDWIGCCSDWFENQIFLRIIKYPLRSCPVLTPLKVTYNSAFSCSWSFIWTKIRLYILCMSVSSTSFFLSFWRMASLVLFFQGESYLHQYWNAQRPCQVLLLAYLGWGITPVSWSWLMADRCLCRYLQGTAPDSSSSWWTFTRLLIQDRRLSPLGYCNGPWIWYWLQVSDLGFWSESSYLFPSCDWMPVLFFSWFICIFSFRGTEWFSFDLPPFIIF